MNDNRAGDGLKGGVSPIADSIDAMRGFDDIDSELKAFIEDMPLPVDTSQVLYFQKNFGVKRTKRELLKLLHQDFPDYQPPTIHKERIAGTDIMSTRRSHTRRLPPALVKRLPRSLRPLTSEPS